MDKTINVGLSGHAQQFRLGPDAYDRLARYLDRAAARLQDDPDRAEVLGDLERSIGDRLAARPGPTDRSSRPPRSTAILDEVGTVDTGREHGPDEARARRAAAAARIREGQQIAGVCTGLAAYSEIGSTGSGRCSSSDALHGRLPRARVHRDGLHPAGRPATHGPVLTIRSGRRPRSAPAETGRPASP